MKSQKFPKQDSSQDEIILILGLIFLLSSYVLLICFWNSSISNKLRKKKGLQSKADSSLSSRSLERGSLYGEVQVDNFKQLQVVVARGLSHCGQTDMTEHITFLQLQHHHQGYHRPRVEMIEWWILRETGSVCSTW